MDDLHNKMIYKILSYCNPDDYSNICSLWWEIAKEQKSRDYIEKEIAQSGESREFSISQDKDYLNNWL